MFMMINDYNILSILYAHMAPIHTCYNWKRRKRGNIPCIKVINIIQLWKLIKYYKLWNFSISQRFHQVFLCTKLNISIRIMTYIFINIVIITQYTFWRIIFRICKLYCFCSNLSLNFPTHPLQFLVSEELNGNWGSIWIIILSYFEWSYVLYNFV